MNKIFTLALIALLVSGCAQQSFQIKDVSVVAPKKTTTHHFFVSGIGQQKAIDAAQVCGGADKVVKTEVQLTFFNGLASALTFGIYTPREARIYCSQ